MCPSDPQATSASETPWDAFRAARIGLDLDPHANAVRAALSRTEDAVLGAWSEPPPHLGAFWSELARCIPGEVDASALSHAIDGIPAPDLHLAFACRMGDAAAVAKFEREIMRELDGVVRRFDPSAEFVDEVKQRVRTKLLVSDVDSPPKIALYTGQGPLQTWVRVIAVREAISSLRAERRRALASDEDLVAIQSDATGPDLLAIRDQYRAQFQDAFTRALSDLDPAARNLLRLHYVHGLTLDELGRVLSVHRSSAARRVAKTRKELIASTRRHMREALSVGRDEFEQLMAVVLSRIDLTIERFFG